MTMLPRTLKNKIKQKALQRLGICYSPVGLDTRLLSFFRPKAEVSLIDVGASAGEFTNNILNSYGINKAILVEPQPDRCAQLHARFKGSKFAIENCALADCESTREMDILNWDYSSSLLTLRRDISKMTAVVDVDVRTTIKCRTTTLDTIVAEQKAFPEVIDLLKLDVQGAELLVLRGGQLTLAKTRFVLTEIAFSPLYEGGCSAGEVHDYLSQAGLRLMSLHDGFRGQGQELLECDALYAR